MSWRDSRIHEIETEPEIPRLLNRFWNSVSMTLVSAVLGLWQVSIVFLVIFVFVWKYAPQQFEPFECLSLIPIPFGAFFLMWGELWRSNYSTGVTKERGWPLDVLIIGFWLMVLVTVFLVFCSGVHWPFFAAISFYALYLGWMCAWVASMSITNVWL